jgi:hypothetical protein
MGGAYTHVMTFNGIALVPVLWIGIVLMLIHIRFMELDLDPTPGFTHFENQKKILTFVLNLVFTFG